MLTLSRRWRIWVRHRILVSTAKTATSNELPILPTMSLPGLDLSAPVEKPTLPAIHELKEGSEWRFEVAFGTQAEVKVTMFPKQPAINTTHCARLILLIASLWQC